MPALLDGNDAGLPVTSIFAGGFPATGGDAGAPWHLCFCRWLPITHIMMSGPPSLLFLQAVCQLPGGAVDPWYLHKDANYLMMQGLLSPLYLQAVCHLPAVVNGAL